MIEVLVGVSIGLIIFPLLESFTRMQARRRVLRGGYRIWRERTDLRGGAIPSGLVMYSVQWPEGGTPLRVTLPSVLEEYLKDQGA